jgi:tripartite-type tricarboxylate transporter receptor subunit TctC
VAAHSRLPNLPDLPTAAEAGLPDFQAEGWNALFAPRGVPAPIIAKLHGALRSALDSPALRKRMNELGVTPPSPDELSPEYTQKLVQGDIEKLRRLLAAAQ